MSKELVKLKKYPKRKSIFKKCKKERKWNDYKENKYKDKC
jgi:hypothetical protein